MKLVFPQSSTSAGWPQSPGRTGRSPAAAGRRPRAAAAPAAEPEGRCSGRGGPTRPPPGWSGYTPPPPASTRRCIKSFTMSHDLFLHFTSHWVKFHGCWLPCLSVNVFIISIFSSLKYEWRQQSCVFAFNCLGLMVLLLFLVKMAQILLFQLWYTSAYVSSVSAVLMYKATIHFFLKF